MSRRISRRAARIWKRLLQHYGTRLTDQYDDACPDDWQAVINRHDDRALDVAIVTIRSRYPSQPPTLGEFEATIPRRARPESDNLVDRLAVHAAASFRMCLHQRGRPWSYFGRTEEVVTERGIERVRVVRGVLIPACDCDEGGNAGYRLLVRDLPPPNL